MSDVTLNDVVSVFPTINKTGVGDRKQEHRVVDFVKVNRDLDMNPRKHEAYTLGKSGWMGRSLATYGQQEPVLLSQREDNSLHLLRGFIRFAGIDHVRNTGIPAVSQGKGETPLPAIDRNPDFMSKVNALVMKGLSRQQEIDLVMDHGTKTGLSLPEKYESAKIMTKNGFSRLLIAAKLNMTVSNYNNQIGRILSLPPVVEEAFLNPKSVVKITQETLKVLYPAYEEDQDLRKNPDAKVRVAGESFATAWEKLAKEGNPKRPAGMNKAEITALISVTANADIRDLLQAVRDDNSQNAAQAIQRLEMDIKLSMTTNSGFVRIEEGIESTLHSYVPIVD